MEIWKDITDYEGLYQVSNYGRIKSLGNGKTRKEKILKGVKNNKGYLLVCLCKEGKGKNFTIHRLVAQAFIPNPHNLPEVNHKDENPSNNHVENLEWCDRRYNINYGTHNIRSAKTLTNRVDLSKQVAQYDLNGKLIKVFPSAKEAERQTGFDVGNISKCCNGIYNQSYGYKWKYLN